MNKKHCYGSKLIQHGRDYGLMSFKENPTYPHSLNYDSLLSEIESLTETFRGISRFEKLEYFGSII